MKKLISILLIILLIFNGETWTSVQAAPSKKTSRAVKKSSADTTTKKVNKSSSKTASKKKNTTIRSKTSKTSKTKIATSNKKKAPKKVTTKSTAKKRLSTKSTTRRIVASRSAAGYGELLDWSVAKEVFSIGSKARVIDLLTGKSFYVIRTYGHLHADVEAASKEDTEIIKDIWNGFSWERRPVIVEVNGRRIAASMTSMPHAGVDSAPEGKIVNGRSGGYGRGMNLDKIKGNGMDGHIDIHFLNSRRHKDGAVDKDHQEMIKKAAGF
ncbi:hypothetical protein Q3V94_09125 [Caloramator sp. CAR-1]|uniref:hypothetical protein n=2 Tax=unclassified Caloramator TaxID=2629145 RepID=UPI0026E16A9E|nr:hypothetical protein [Caloramator sp. CAR-1]MDO6355226.1 hypothetical protein [Caloramator sp. CAR-1]